eukprot:1184599-Prorocentrum_minimum.AAC.4
MGGRGAADDDSKDGQWRHFRVVGDVDSTARSDWSCAFRLFQRKKTSAFEEGTRTCIREKRKQHHQHVGVSLTGGGPGGRGG